MTPKEKAVELFNSMYKVENMLFLCVMDTYQAKQCAIICVDEIIEQYEYIGTYLPDFAKQHIGFWNAVKKELITK